MSNEISLQQTINQLMASLSNEEKAELAKFATEKQIEIAAETMKSQQAGLVHENKVNAMISKIAAAGDVDSQVGRRTKIETTIRDEGITTHITSTKSWF